MLGHPVGVLEDPDPKRGRKDVARKRETILLFCGACGGNETEGLKVVAQWQQALAKLMGTEGARV